ncbi:vitamin b12-dependent ribonucleotide reductase [Anaeramoeba ignava]|uniref:ribonucleoside-diphosphate reductase n=1 Tax=Anaeramoeba ignava TaxID=1746090 RepID=A0A9Q0LEY5_ANAIG|nr:vitamin b12-dependent ribonucleotide reductase [Anaeramoeba ignava]
MSIANLAQQQIILQGMTTNLPFSANGLQVLAQRYLRKGTGKYKNKLMETPEQFIQRVSKGLAEVEQNYDKTDQQVFEFQNKFSNVMSHFEFIPAGRTLASTGVPGSKIISNCVVLHMNDSLESIFSTLRDAAILQQAGCGIGFPFHKLRPAGTPTKLYHSSGPVSFMNIYNTTFGVIKQDGRNGANMAVLSVDHPDVLEFINCKTKEGDLKNFNISIGLTDKFMEQVISKEQKPWVCEWQGKKIKPRRIKRDNNFNLIDINPVTLTANQIFDEIIENSWKNGEPGCVFLDLVNKSNPLPGLGRLEACNPCGEQFLHDGDCCNLGSLNLSNFVINGEIKYQRLKEVIDLAVRMLDNVIDLTVFPVEHVQRIFQSNRRIGLGVMGFADMLYKLNIGYNTEKAVNLAEEVMKFIQEYSHLASEKLAHEKGVFPNYDYSIWRSQGILMRNAAVTNVPPTGSISLLFNVSSGIEPYFALAYNIKNILGGKVELSYTNDILVSRLKEAGVYSDELMQKIIQKGSLKDIPEIPQNIKDVFVTAMDISAKDHILMQSTFQKYCDNAISKTINHPNSATLEEIKQGFIEAWKLGCKGATVYRDKSRKMQVLNLNEKQENDKKNGEENDKQRTVGGIETPFVTTCKDGTCSI